MRLGYWKILGEASRVTFAAMAACGFFACTDNNVAGNSAETGSPELAGLLNLDNGAPAAMARVLCVPASFDARFDTLSPSFAAVADENGAYTIDSILPGTYSIEAFHPETGKLLLVQDVVVADSGDVSVGGTLEDAGFALLKVPEVFENGTEGIAFVLGTTILRQVAVDSGTILVDSLPADTLDLHVLFTGVDSVLAYSNLSINPRDTLKVGFEAAADTTPVDTVPEEPVDTLILTYANSLALPADFTVDTTIDMYSSDIPLALRLDSTNCDFSAFGGRAGRWEVTRVSPDGTRSRKLPLMQTIFDTTALEAVFWVRVDSLNYTDSLELVFNTSLEPVNALDLFATNRSYTAVYHFDDGVASISDASERNGYTATGTGLKQVAGVVGYAAEFSGEESSVMVIDNSAESDTSKHSDLNYAFNDYANFSFWIRLDDISSPAAIISKGSSQYDVRYSPDSGFVAEFFHEASTAAIEGDSTADTTGYVLTIATGTESIEQGVWTYVSVNKYGPRAVNLFLNGNKLSATAQKVAWDGTRDTSKDVQIGPFKGAIDELAISKTARFDGWTVATYVNQRPVSNPWPAISFGK